MYSRVCLGGAHPVGFDKRIKTRSHQYCITQSSFAVVMCYNSHRKLKQSRSADWKGAMRQGTGPGPTNPPNAPGLAFRHSFALHPTGALIPPSQSLLSAFLWPLKATTIVPDVAFLWKWVRVGS